MTALAGFWPHKSAQPYRLLRNDEQDSTRSAGIGAGRGDVCNTLRVKRSGGQCLTSLNPLVHLDWDRSGERRTLGRPATQPAPACLPSRCLPRPPPGEQDDRASLAISGAAISILLGILDEYASRAAIRQLLFGFLYKIRVIWRTGQAR